MKSYIKGLNRNISISYIYSFLMYFRLTNAIWVIYLSFKGLSLTQIGILESVFHLSCFICEIPTGALSDIYGRKFSIVLGRVSSIISTLLMIYSSSMLGFAVAFVFSGLSYTFNSGAQESLNYDSLKELGREGSYKKTAGQIYFLTEAGQACAVILGGYLSDIRFLYAYLGTLVIDLLSVITSLGFTEPKIHEETRGKSLISQVKESLCILRDVRLVLYLILFFELIATMGTTVYLYSQKFFEIQGFSKFMIAIVFTFDSVINALSGKYAYKIEKRLTQRGIIILLPVLNLAGLIGLSLSSGYYVIIFTYIISFITGVGYPIFSDYINSLIPSKNRSTILSMQSCAFSLSMIVFFPLVGFIGDRVSLSRSFLIIGLSFIPLIAFLMLKLKKHRM